MARGDFRFQRGVFVRDKITGFSGVVVSRTDYITSCDAYGVQPVEIEDGKLPRIEYFDDNRLELVPEKAQQKIELYTREQPPG